MLSICIPIYNVQVKSLVAALLSQASRLGIPYEVILMDDHSTNYREENSKLQGVTYIGLEENIGRARIRNRLAKAARYDHILFLDCDSEIVSNDFLKNYVTEINNKEKVVCGGRVYRNEPPSRDKRLHWKYGKEIESRPASVRMANAYQSFMTNNFLIEKKVLETIPFDERLSGYGHEDTLLGYQLKQKGIPIKHIDNSILHADIQTNVEFLQKTECAISNLKKILEYVNYDKAFIEDVMLLRYYMAWKKSRFIFFVKLFFFPTKSFIKGMLSRGFANIALFNIYKLGYISTHGNRQDK